MTVLESPAFAATPNTALQRLQAVLAERDEEIRCLRQDNAVLVHSLQALALHCGNDEVAEEIIAGLELSGRGAH